MIFQLRISGDLERIYSCQINFLEYFQIRLIRVLIKEANTKGFKSVFRSRLYPISFSKYLRLKLPTRFPFNFNHQFFINEQSYDLTRFFFSLNRTIETGKVSYGYARVYV